MDPDLIKMKAEIANLADKPEQKKELEKQIQEREQFLRPLYQQVAIQFADLHDTPERMLEKGVIQVINECNKPFRALGSDLLKDLNLFIGYRSVAIFSYNFVLASEKSFA